MKKSQIFTDSELEAIKEATVSKKETNWLVTLQPLVEEGVLKTANHIKDVSQIRPGCNDALLWDAWGKVIDGVLNFPNIRAKVGIVADNVAMTIPELKGELKTSMLLFMARYCWRTYKADLPIDNYLYNTAFSAFKHVMQEEYQLAAKDISAAGLDLHYEVPVDHEGHLDVEGLYEAQGRKGGKVNNINGKGWGADYGE